MTITLEDPPRDGRPERPSRRHAGRRRALVWVAAFLVISTAAYFAGQALHPRPKRAAVSCPLVASPGTDGRLDVTYVDATDVPAMSSALRTAIAAWDASATDVRLVPARGRASLTFRAGAATTPVPRCASTAARTLTVVLGAAAWLPGKNGRSRVRQPVAALAKTIGLALGLHSAGRCPALMAAPACPQRSSRPDASEVAAVDRLYPSG